MDNCNGFVYVVQENDSLYSISRRFNISLAWLINANRYNDIYNLYIGKRICIPNHDPYVEVIPIVPIRPWPGNLTEPGPEEQNDNQNPYTSGPRFDPRDPRYGKNNPFGRIGDDGSQDDLGMYDDDREEANAFVDADLEIEEKESGATGDNSNRNVGTTKKEDDDMWNGREYVRNPGANMSSQPSSTPYVVISYVVKNDDNLSSILEKFKITPSDVLRYNDTLRIYLKPGTILKVPNFNAMDEQKYEPR